jgi:hypothetical protein
MNNDTLDTSTSTGKKIEDPGINTKSTQDGMLKHPFVRTSTEPRDPRDNYNRNHWCSHDRWVF